MLSDLEETTVPRTGLDMVHLNVTGTIYLKMKYERKRELKNHNNLWMWVYSF